MAPFAHQMQESGHLVMGTPKSDAKGDAMMLLKLIGNTHRWIILGCRYYFTSAKTVRSICVHNETALLGGWEKALGR